PLLAQAAAIRDEAGDTAVFVSLDNCEVNRPFVETIYRDLESRHGLKRGAVIIASSHTHSGPVLDGVLNGMYALSETEMDRVRAYSRSLKRSLVEVVDEAMANLAPARLAHGVGRATFAMNRRVYRDDGIAFGENPDGPTDPDVPVLGITDEEGALRGILFGYACHGTTITRDDFYRLSPEYMGHARNLLETHYPGATAMFLPGFGADLNPSPRATLLDAKRHGLRLAGAVMSALSRPMRAIEGRLALRYEEIALPLTEPPTREQLETDARDADRYVRARAEAHLEKLEAGVPPPSEIPLPVASIRFGDGLTFVAVAGEVVVDYAVKFKRTLADLNPWFVGCAYEVPCYIPTVRILREGGYEADYSMIYYGVYGRFQGSVERLLGEHVAKLARSSR
ncbi:MAG: neutral/alkaline non-lysosomal ceramidase N-terminal domain-containing protein, partial [Pseudanabaenales cyanobacterium]|nr:neutral/alkaline non-lysosomal ceramidase N-terminal domain-containing protein [Pseudanabaenales cyanobacterium]